MEDQLNGVDLTPTTIGFARFNRFNKQVEDFVKGGNREIQLDDIHVGIETGSYQLKLLLPFALAQLVLPDIQRLNTSTDLDGMNPKRTEIVKIWQDQARRHSTFKVSIKSPEHKFRQITISDQSDYHQKSEDLWVKIEKYLTGRVMDMGGKDSANVHFQVKGMRKLQVLSSSEDYLRDQKENMLYHDVQVRIIAEQNIETRDLRNLKLIEFIGGPPSYNEDELNQAIKKGTKCWADVEDITQWVAEQRGRI